MDARVARTRTALQHALFDLIKEKRWEKITVQDLLDRTGISRSTFYAHYDNKLDVLIGEVPQLASMITIDPTTSKVELLALFQHHDEMADVLAPLLGQHVLGAISSAVEDGMAEFFATIVPAESSATLPGFLAGAMIASIRAYVTDRRRPPPEVVAAQVEGYINRLLDADR